MTDLGLLQLIRVKGLTNAATLAAAMGEPEDGIRVTCDRWTSEGLLSQTPRGLRLTPVGRERVANLIAEERKGLDPAVLQSIYAAFCELNCEFKAAVGSWQMRNETTPNDHSDTAYDNQVIANIARVDERMTPLLGQLSTVAPRFGTYRPRLSRALERVRAGDTSFMARPVIDSYHTVWFELHEDLIAITGRTRAAEAAAGRGA
jgi:pyruvate,orthophosphate dikinase